MPERARWVLPEVVDPDEHVCFVVRVPNEKFHIAAFKGALWNLATAVNWQNDNAHTAKNVAAVWRKIFFDLVAQSCEILPEFGLAGTDTGVEQLIRQDPDNPCLLQSSVDGVVWCTFADFSKCIPAPQQPGSGTEQPGANGGSQCYKGEFSAGGKYLIPFPVSAGDVLQITRITGAGTDGSAAWFCPDGLSFFAGACGGIPHFSGSDPVPSAPHMSVIVEIDGSFYALDNTLSLTVPGGVTAKQPLLLVNDASLSDNYGNYQFEVCVVNNAATTFTHHFDFAGGTYGFVQNLFGGNSNAVWNAGSGYSSSIVNSPPLSGEGTIDIHLHCPRVLSNVTLRLVGTVSDGSVNGQSLYKNVGVFPPQNVGEVYTQHLSGAIDFSHAFTSSMADFALQVIAGTTIGDTCTLTDAWVTADGTDPF